MEIKSMPRIRKKWKERAAVAGGDYKEGVQQTKKDWATNTGNAETSYEQGVQASIADKRFGKGVQAAGTAKWLRKATELGAARFPQGVAAAEDDYDKGFSPYREIIAGLTLPDRYPRGDPRNLERVKVITEALHAHRVGG